MPTPLLFGDTQRSAALRHEVPITIIDPLLWAEVGGRTVILTSRLEQDRIGAVLPDAEILDFFDSRDSGTGGSAASGSRTWSWSPRAAARR